MKNIKRFAFCLALVSLLCSLCIAPALASDTVETTTNTTYYEDGSYMVETIVSHHSSTRALRGVSGTKVGHYYNSDGDLLLTFSVNGDFLYNGSFAIADSASYDYTIYDSAWSLDTASASCSGATAKASATFVCGLFMKRSTSISLTCSADGVLS